MEKKTIWPRVLSWLVSFVITVALAALGALVLDPVLDGNTENFLFAMLILALCLLWIFNLCFYCVYIRKAKNKQRVLDMLMQLRDGGALARAVLERKLRRQIRITRIYTPFVMLLTAGACVMAYVFPGLSVIPLLAMQQLVTRFWPEKDEFDPDLPAMEDAFALQYALVNKAREAVGETRPVRILHDTDCGAAVMFHKGTIWLRLGAALLDNLSQEEVYQVLLHEFAHMQDKEQLRREQHMNSTRKSMLFYCTDLQEVEYFHLQQIFASRDREEKADMTVQQLGDPQAAASAFAKIAYYDYYLRSYLCPERAPEFYEKETPPEDWASRLSADFRQVYLEAPEKARRILDGELQPRVSSHPVMRQRIQNFGITDFTVEFPTHEDPWGLEAKKAVARVDAKLMELNRENYDLRRQENYLEPREKIAAWQAAGEPMTYEDTRDVLDALYFDRRYQEAIDLSRRFAQTNTPEHERCHAVFIEGLSRLKLQDDSGIDVLYKAIELNSNYREPAVEAIGDYCVMLGLQEELERYRAFADNLMQEQIRVDPLFPVTPKDRLEAVAEESFGPWRMNLDFICSAGGEELKRVFLVKKNTSATTCAYIYFLELAPDTEEKRTDEIFNAVFMHLDKQDEEYALDQLANAPWLSKAAEYVIYEK